MNPAGASAVATPAAAAPAATTPPVDADADRRIVAFLCRECAYSAADAAGNARTPLPPTIRTILVPCTGRVSPLHLLTALAGGADGVYVAGCLEGQCHYRVGNLHALDRIAFVKRLLESVGVEPDRAAMFTMSAADTPRFVATARAMHETIARLPRLPRS
ncbi:MAG: hydrogenase iron-sulfur subunit [Candidatus Dormibacteria bacterium]